MEASITINVGMLLCESDVTALMGEGSGTGLSGVVYVKLCNFRFMAEGVIG